MSQVSGHCQRRLELIEGLVESSLHLVQQTEVAQRVAFEPPVADLPCHGKRRFVVRPGFVHASLVGIQRAQVAEQVALPVPIPGLPGQGQCRLEMRPGLVHPAQKWSRLPRPLWASLCNARSFSSRAMASAASRWARAASMRPAWLSRQPRPMSARHSQRRSPTSRARASDASNCTCASASFPQAVQRAAGNPIHPGDRGCSEPGDGPHHGREFDPDPEWPAQPQRRPGALQRVRGHIGVASRGGPATGHDEIVELGAAVGDRRLLVQAGKVRAVSHFRREQRRRTASRVASRRAQVLRRILLHAHEQIEAIVGHLPDKRLVHQRLQRIHGPRRVLVRGQVEDRLHRLEREPALEHRQLRQRGLLGQRQQVPGPIEHRAQRRLPVHAPAASTTAA